MKKNAEYYLNRIPIDFLGEAFEKINDAHGKPLRKGYVLAIAVSDAEGISFVSKFFGASTSKTLGYATSVAEKIARLHGLRMSGIRNIASSQSADPLNPDTKLRTYAGAFVAHNRDGQAVYISLSGGRGDLEEGLSYVCCEKLGLNPSNMYTSEYIEEARQLLSGLKSWDVSETS